MTGPWKFQRWAFETQTGSVARKAVLTALATMADMESGRCEAKQTTIAQWVELGERAVRGHLAALEADGLIARRPQFRRDGRRRGDEYLLLAPGVYEWPDGQPARSAGGQNDRRNESSGHERNESSGHDRHESAGQELPLEDNLSGNNRNNVDRVWEGYLAARKAFRPKSNGCKLGDVERRIIREALKVRVLEDVLAAVEGLFKSEWHTTNEYLGINYALKGGGKSPVPGATIDRMAAIARGQTNGNGRGGTRLKDRLYHGLAWDELTAHAQASAKESAAMGLEVWDGGKDSWEGAEDRRAAAAAVTAERRRNGQVTAGAWDLAGDD